METLKKAVCLLTLSSITFYAGRCYESFRKGFKNHSCKKVAYIKADSIKVPKEE